MRFILHPIVEKLVKIRLTRTGITVSPNETSDICTRSRIMLESTGKAIFVVAYCFLFVLNVLFLMLSKNFQADIWSKFDNMPVFKSFSKLVNSCIDLSIETPSN